MRRLNICLTISLLPLLVSCVAPRQAAVLQPVGPSPLRTVAVMPGTEGALKVYSQRGIYNDEGVNYHPHTAYTILSKEGTRLKQVKNTIYPHDEEPVSVNLAAGKYMVEALAEGYVRVRVPVVIEVGRVTAVYLESSKRPAVAPAEEQAWVRLPTGKTVGWRAE